MKMVNASLNWASICGLMLFLLGLISAPASLANIYFLLNRAGWIVKHLPYWDFYDNGWLPDDHPPAEELRNFVRDYFDNTIEQKT